MPALLREAAGVVESTAALPKEGGVVVAMRGHGLVTPSLRLAVLTRGLIIPSLRLAVVARRLVPSLRLVTVAQLPMLGMPSR